MPHNVPTVTDDISDIKTDLPSKLRRKLSAAMRTLEADARTYVARDASWRGRLGSSLSTDEDGTDTGFEIVTSAGGRQAPHAPFVEFGTGERSEQTSNRAPTTNILFEPMSYPPSFPYDAPGMSPGMVANILEWVHTKPITADDLSQDELGYRIAATIAEEGTYAHPFMRPAWFHNEHTIKQAAENAFRSALR